MNTMQSLMQPLQKSLIHFLNRTKILSINGIIYEICGPIDTLFVIYNILLFIFYYRHVHRDEGRLLIMALFENKACEYADRIVAEITEFITPKLHNVISLDYNPDITSVITGKDYIFYFKLYAVCALVAAFFLGVIIAKYHVAMINVLKETIFALVSTLGISISCLGFIIYHKRKPKKEEFNHILRVWF